MARAAISVREFAEQFELTKDAHWQIAALATRRTTGDLMTDSDLLHSVIEEIKRGGLQPKEPKRLGHNTFGIHYAHAAGLYIHRHSDIGLPYVVECWVMRAEPVSTKDASAEISVGELYVNRAPYIGRLSHGSAWGSHRDFHADGRRSSNPRCTDEAADRAQIVIAITCPELPLLSAGNAVDFASFDSGLVEAVRGALDKASMGPRKSDAEEETRGGS